MSAGSSAKDQAYLSQLQAVSRTRRVSAAKTANAQQEERERGFTTHFSGANKTSDKPVVRGAVRAAGKFNFPAARRRGGWNGAMELQRGGDDGDDYAEDFDKEEDEEFEDSMDEERGSAMPTASAEAEREVSRALLAKVAVLDAAQQALLLSLIDQVASPGARDSGSALSPGIDARRRRNVDGQATDNEKKDLASEAVLDALVTADTPSEATEELALRIRLCSGWGEGHVCLSGVALVGDGGLHVDLRAFSSAVHSGLAPLPFASAAVQGVSKLFQRLPSQPADQWRAPLARGSGGVELHLTGRVCTSITSLRLVVVNSLDPDTRVKDMDVFVGARCVWSGRWDAGAAHARLEVPLGGPGSAAIEASERDELGGTREEAVPLWLSGLKPPSRQSDPCLGVESKERSASRRGDSRGSRRQGRVDSAQDPPEPLVSGAAAEVCESRQRVGSQGGRRRERQASEDDVPPVLPVLPDSAAIPISPRAETETELKRSCSIETASLEGEARQDRLRRRSGKIDEVQEVLAKLADSLAVLVPPTSPTSDMPRGRVLALSVFSTWGDERCVGLNGIELFDCKGTRVQVASVSVLHPSSQTALDSKVLNLLDGCNHTRDDAHAWRMALDDGGAATEGPLCVLQFELARPETLSLLTLWNYNKSRTHRSRGVRQCALELDGRLLFEGEVALASGLLRTPSDNSTSLVLATERDLSADATLSEFIQRCLHEDSVEEEEEDELAQSTASVSRPAPAYGELRASVQIEAPSVVAPVRAIQGSVASVAHRHASSPVEVRSPPLQSSHRHADFARGRTVRVVIESTWGGGDFCGLTGVQVLLGRELRPAVVHRGSVVGSPHGLADIGYEDDARTPDKLVDGVNNTTSEDHMWLFPFTMGGEHSLVLTLAEESDVYGLRVWNYNRGQEAARTRGARQVRVLVDGLDVCEAELRMGPGFDGIDFGQTLLFAYAGEGAAAQRSAAAQRYISPPLRQSYETPMLPSGMLWSFVFPTNYTDPYYVGMDSLELLDAKGRRIDVLSAATVASLPPSITELGLSEPGDDRSARNLFGHTGGMWLAPLCRNTTEEERRLAVRLVQGKGASGESHCLPKQNVLFVMFNQPVTVACIRFHNYSKTPARGVRDVSISVDGRVAYMGAIGIGVAGADGDVTHAQSVLFTHDPAMLRMEKPRVLYCGSGDQDVLCINERQVIVRSKAMYEKPLPTAEGIHTDVALRPHTMMSGKA